MIVFQVWWRWYLLASVDSHLLALSMNFAPLLATILVATPRVTSRRVVVIECRVECICCVVRWRYVIAFITVRVTVSITLVWIEYWLMVWSKLALMDQMFIVMRRGCGDRWKGSNLRTPPPPPVHALNCDDHKTEQAHAEQCFSSLCEHSKWSSHSGTW